ncbi:retrovirus-related pol polyprotein from transposon TNT 1-94 [Tanacetum coccineum]
MTLGYLSTVIFWGCDTLADGVLSSIEEKKSEKDIWDHLARLYEARSLHNKNFSKRKVYALLMTESTLVIKHVQQHGGHVNQFKIGGGLGGDKRRSMEPGSSGSHNHGMKILVERKLLPGLKKELVQSDVWQAPIQSPRGAKYFVSFIDDYSKRCWVYPIKKKYDVFEVSKVYKLDLKSRKCLFLGYANEVKGYRLLDLTAHKVVVNRDVVFIEDKIQENEEGDNTTRETILIQMEKQYQSNDSSKAAPQHEENKTTESQAPMTRTLNRERKRPSWHSDYVMERNKAAMQEETEALHKNKTWEMMLLPGDRKPIGNKWVYKIKRNGDDQVESPSSKEERMEMSRVPYASGLGSLMFTMICTRPNIAHAVGVVSQYMAEPGREHRKAVKRILRYIKGTSDVIYVLGIQILIVKGYVDSDYESVVAMSTIEAEYVAAAQPSKEASALYLARNLAFHSKTKHIRVQYHFVREKVEEGTVDMQKIHTDDNVADYMTKAINCDKFIWCRSSCGLAET